MIKILLNLDNYAFTFIAAASMLVGILVELFGFYVLVRERVSRTGMLFCLFATCMSIWLTCFGFLYASVQPAVAMWWLKCSYTGVTFIPATGLLLAYAVIPQRGATHLRKLIPVSIVLSALFLVATVFTDTLIKGLYQYSWGYYPRYAPAGILFLLYFALTSIYILRLFWIGYRSSAGTKTRKRFIGLLLGFSIGYLASADFIAVFGIPFYPVGYIVIIPSLVIIAYIASRYRLIDITPELAASQILETMQGAVLAVNLEGRIQVVNRAAADMIGFSKPDLIGRHLSSLTGLPAELGLGFVGGMAFAAQEMTWIRKDGNRLVVTVSASPITDINGTVIGAVIAAHDITERRVMEQRLRDSEARLRQSQFVARIGHYVFDIPAGIWSSSEALDDIFGIQPAYARSVEGWLSLIHPEQRSEMSAYLADHVLRDRAPFDRVYRIMRQSDGGVRWVHGIGNLEMSSDGRPLRMFGTIQDITESKRVEEELRSSEARFRAIIENASAGILVADMETKRVRYANPKICSMLGYGAQELQGLLITDLSTREELPSLAAAFQAHAERKTQASEQSLKRRDGSSVRMSINSVRIELDGRPCLVGFYTDITEKYLLEEERLKTQKLEAIGTLAGGIAHDFNNLLQGVFGYISLAKLMCDNREKNLASLDEAEKALHMAVKMTNQLLTFSKGGKPMKKPVDLQPVIENAAKFALSGSRSGYQITVDDGLWQAEADEGQIGQVIQNIVLNADQAMPAGGQVMITARNVHVPGLELLQGLEKGRYVEIAIRDTGIGIVEEHLGRIFDPYFTTKEKGSGLGLATSYSIVKNHNGMIDVRSEAGKGATFIIYLPATAAVKKEEQARPAAGEPGRTARVLVLDDEPFILDIAGELIRTLGHNVEFASHGKEAIEKYREAQRSGLPFDVVILDLTIRGGMGGAETLKKLLEIDPGVAAVVSSGYSDDEVIAGYREEGFKAFLKKPYNIHELEAVLNRLLSS